MGTYYFRRYRRTAPGCNTGTIIDELSFSAESAFEAETHVRKHFGVGMVAMNWQNDFARLEDDEGNVLIEWLRGFTHA